MRQLLKTKLVDMDLSVRALNCLKAADVETLGDLVQFNKTDLLKFRNFGKKSLTELDVSVTFRLTTYPTCDRSGCEKITLAGYYNIISRIMSNLLLLLFVDNGWQ